MVPRASGPLILRSSLVRFSRAVIWTALDGAVDAPDNLGKSLPCQLVDVHVSVERRCRVHQISRRGIKKFKLDVDTKKTGGLFARCIVVGVLRTRCSVPSPTPRRRPAGVCWLGSALLGGKGCVEGRGSYVPSVE